MPLASGVVPIALALIGDRFAYEHRGRALGWLFGAMAGGMAFGSSAGAMLEPFLGWRGLFFGVALVSVGAKRPPDEQRLMGWHEDALDLENACRNWEKAAELLAPANRRLVETARPRHPGRGSVRTP